MLYVILVNTCRVNQLIFTVQYELSKLQINLVKISFFFCKKQQKSVCFAVKPVDFYRFTVGKPLPVGRFLHPEWFCKPWVTPALRIHCVPNPWVPSHYHYLCVQVQRAKPVRTSTKPPARGSAPLPQF
jgi:hypothetical protein